MVMKLLNEFVVKFKCKRCFRSKTIVFPCAGQLSVMKAGLKQPDNCGCGANDWEIWGILNVDIEERKNNTKKGKITAKGGKTNENR